MIGFVVLAAIFASSQPVDAAAARRRRAPGSAFSPHPFEFIEPGGGH
jgi:hypothetical protein